MSHKRASIILATLLMVTPVASTLATGYPSSILAQQHSALTGDDHHPAEQNAVANKPSQIRQSANKGYRPGPLPLPLATLIMLTAITGMGAFICKTTYQD